MGNGMDAFLRASKTVVSGKETCEIQTEVMTSEFYVALEVCLIHVRARPGAGGSEPGHFNTS